MAESLPRRIFHAIEVTGHDDPDFVLAELDACHPTAVDDLGPACRVFFASASDRALGAEVLRTTMPHLSVTPVDVPDEQWAERSQAALTAVRVGRLTVAPPWDRPDDGSIVIEILPSMGFGTGHHASTRLCLGLLQDIPLAGQRACDVGTGSGVLAIAALRLGASEVIALDYDPDAVACTEDAARRNAVTHGLDVRQWDLEQHPTVAGAPFEVVIANLTGALLVRLVAPLVALTTEGGTLILSGITAEEADSVIAAFAAAGCHLAARRDEDGWVGLRLTSPTPTRAGSAPQ